ncbi:MAG: 5'-nucleotidase, partial [Gemmatimonadota bacterium]
FRLGDLEAYRDYLRSHESEILEPGIAFPFVRRLLGLNRGLEGDPVEVVLLSQNSSDTGLRVMESIEAHGLDISRAAFLSGEDPGPYMEAFNAVLFLSANEDHVRRAMEAGLPAGRVHGRIELDDSSDEEVRIAFDFDGVLVDDAAEAVYAERGLAKYQQHETEHATEPLDAGPLKAFLERVAELQKQEKERLEADPSYKIRLKTAIVTARNAPAHKRVVHTLRDWGIHVDQTFFLGGMDKSRVLKEFKPHVFFDDQWDRVEEAGEVAPSVHIPFGVRNQEHTDQWDQELGDAPRQAPEVD